MGLAHLQRIVPEHTEVVVGVDGSSQTTDDDLRGLKRLPTLETLELQSTKVTDAGLVHLKGLSNLKNLASL